MRIEFEDAHAGPLSLSAELHDAGSDTLIVLVHGLGGSTDSLYMRQGLAACEARGLSALAVNLRGADRRGDDVYHAALTDDLQATLAHEVCQGFGRIHVMGFSLGGHMVLRWNLAPSDERVTAVASLCAPLDLAAACRHIDHPLRRPYLGHVLGGLKEMHSAWASRQRACRADRHVQQVTRLRDWDEHVIVPRFGFGTADDYYREAAMAPHMSDLKLPALVVAARQDPMIPAASLREPLTALPEHSEARWVDGGHLGFAAGTDPIADAVDWLQGR